MKKIIKKSEYLQILGLMTVARNAYKTITECEKSYGKIVDMKKDIGSYGHFSDQIFGHGDVDLALEREGIKVKK